MSEATVSTFSCSACGKLYKWKLELGGKKMKCKCGQVIPIPADDPAPVAAPAPIAARAPIVAPAPIAIPATSAIPALQEDDDLGALEQMAATTHVEVPRQEAPAQNDDDMYDLAETEQPKAKRVRPALVAAGAGAVAAAVPSPMLGYSRAPVADERDDNDPNSLKELVPAICCFAAGVLLSLVHSMYFDRFTLPFGAAMAMVGIRLLIDMVFITIACLAVMNWLEISFGSPGPALIKIAAIALVGPPIGSMVSYFIHDPIGIIGSVIAFVAVWILFVKLFDLETNDVWIITGVVVVVRIWAGYIVLAFILSGMGIGFGGMGGPKLGEAEVNADRMASERIDMGRTIDAKPWVEESGHCFGQAPNVVSKKFVDGLLAAGCKSVLIEHSGPYAGDMIAELPSGDAKRKAAFDAAQTFCDETGNDPPVDKGQKYLQMGFSMYYAPPTSGPSGTPGATPRIRRRGMPLGSMNSF